MRFTPKITDAWAAGLQATLDTEEFLKETLGDPDEDLQAQYEAWLDGDDAREWGDCGGWLATIGWELVCEDNTYNRENDLSRDFVFRVALPKGSSRDWVFGDVIVLVAVHRGGDVRGNYGAHRVYRVEDLAETGFLDPIVSWGIELAWGPDGEELDEVAARELDERWEAGYSGNPTYQMNEEISQVLEHAESRATVKLNSGVLAWVYPWRRE